MKMDTLISSLVPPVFEKAASRANSSRKRRNRKALHAAAARTAKASHTSNKHSANARSAGLSTRSANRNSSAFNNVSQKLRSGGKANGRAATNGAAAAVAAAKDARLHSIALQQIRSSNSSGGKRGPVGASSTSSSAASSSTAAAAVAAAERHKMYFSAFESSSGSGSGSGSSASHRSSSGSTDARLHAYQRELSAAKSKTYSGYPASHAARGGLNDAAVNRAARNPAAAASASSTGGFAPNCGAASMALASEHGRSGQGGVPPPPPMPTMSGVSQPIPTFYRTTGGHPQAAPQQVMYPSHANYVAANTYEQYTGAMLAANHAAAAAAAMHHAPHTWSTAVGVSAAAQGSGAGAPGVYAQGRPSAPQRAHTARSSFMVLPDENTRPPHSFSAAASSSAAQAAGVASSASSLSAKASSSEASASLAPQSVNAPSQFELGPYTRPLPMNPKQVSAKSASQSLSMPVTDENSAFSGNYAQPPAQAQSASVLTEPRAKLKSADASMRQASVHVPSVNPECELSMRGVNPECGSQSMKEADHDEATMTDEAADADSRMEVEKAAPPVVPPIRAKRPADGRAMSAEQLANDCDLFFDSDEILVGMRQSERECAPLILKDYMSVQKSLNNRMRLIVIDWLFEVEQEYSLDDRTMFLAVNYLDRFLSQVHLRRDQLQLVGTTCLYLASKFQEIDPPSGAQYTFIADKTFSIDQLFQMETCILDVLSFRLCATTSYDFLLTFAMKLDMPEQARHFALYLLSLFVESVNYGRFLPSQEAAAAIYLTKLNIFGDDSWTEKPQRVTGYSFEHLKEVVALYDAMHRTQYEHFVKHFLFDRGAPGHAVSDKFASTQFGEVSKVIAPLNYAGPRVTQPCDPRKLREGTIRCR